MRRPFVKESVGCAIRLSTLHLQFINSQAGTQLLFKGFSFKKIVFKKNTLAI